MKIIILLGLLGATMSAPLAPQHLMSASNSNELLLNLRNGQLLPLQFQGPFNSWISPISGIPQQQLQTQIPGLSQFSLSTIDQFARLFPNHVPFPGQISFAQGTQVSQLEPSQPQTPSQTQQDPNHVMSYVFPFKMPQEQRQMLQYYPVYMLVPWEDHQQTVTESPSQTPPQTGQQQFEEQMPFYTQFGYIPQQAEPVMPRGQQQVAFEPFIGTAPEAAVMAGGGVIPYLQKKMTHFKHTSTGIFTPSTSQKPTTTNFASTLDSTIPPELMEEKITRCDSALDINLGYLFPQC